MILPLKSTAHRQDGILFYVIKMKHELLRKVHVDSPMTLPVIGCREIIFRGFFVNDYRENQLDRSTLMV